MRTLITTVALLCLVSGVLNAQANKSENLDDWTQWRGPYETGVAPAGDPPTKWSETMNVKWKSEIPGIGHATPIIWKDQMILLTAVQTDKQMKKSASGPNGEQADWMNPRSTDFIHQFTVVSVNRTTGKIQWQTVVREEVPYSSTHEFGSWASNSPVTDGAHIFAYFGSHGLYCLTLDGEIVWEKDLGRMEKVMNFGEGSSPYLYQDKLVVLRDHQGQSAIHVMDKRSGEILWEKDREEVSSWSTPTVVEFEGKAQLITAATNKVRSYDISNGKLLWECGGLTRNVIPSPLYLDGKVYVMSGYRGNALLAIDLAKASGDITGSDAIVWSYDESTTPYTPGPVLMDGKLYFLKANNGYLSCLDARDGTVYFAAEKLEGIKNIFTSPLGVKDRLYVLGTNGVTSVVKAGEEFEVVAENKLDDEFFASPVVLGDDLYLRGVNALYCISE